MNIPTVEFADSDCFVNNNTFIPIYSGFYQFNVSDMIFSNGTSRAIEFGIRISMDKGATWTNFPMKNDFMASADITYSANAVGLFLLKGTWVQMYFATNSTSPEKGHARFSGYLVKAR